MSAKTQKIIHVFKCPYCNFEASSERFMEVLTIAEQHIRSHKYSKYDVTKHIKTYKVIE